MDYSIILCIILSVVTVILTVKLICLKVSIKGMTKQFKTILNEDTNSLIVTSSRDRSLLRHANVLNSQISVVKELRHKYARGDRELKEAVTNVSHDLRTPLTAICGYAELLQEEELGDNAVRYVGMIKSRAEAMSKLTEELFKYSMIASEDSKTPESIDVVPVLEEAVASFFDAFAQRGITPEITLPDKPVIRMTDRTSVKRIFENVLSNAAKYSDGDLTVTMTDDCSVSFINMASGLSVVEAGRLFDRFYTVNSARSSTGLGLSIAKTLAERLGGSIKAEYSKECLCITFKL